ncbi:hypothetical protein T4E_2622 [Trichinella pseudospiralis]|uniref:Uncharacterized protein n=1 Tax=Trichinella pseudospiralis TaxID=6337 RepID=A0A0V0XHB3_TRIPS|nr:hypothetical protein T4E_2622 [Trichinella pseudospiralis]
MEERARDLFSFFEMHRQEDSSSGGKTGLNNARGPTPSAPLEGVGSASTRPVARSALRRSILASMS